MLPSHGDDETVVVKRDADLEDTPSCSRPAQPHGTGSTRPRVELSTECPLHILIRDPALLHACERVPGEGQFHGYPSSRTRKGRLLASVSSIITMTWYCPRGRETAKLMTNDE